MSAPADFSLSGGCLCGKVRFSYQGPVHFSGMCHCRDCQKASGSVGLQFIAIDEAAFDLRGETRSHGSIGGSGKTTERYFCPNCGSRLFGRAELLPGRIMLFAGALDEPDMVPPDHAVFVRDRPHWLGPDSALKEFETVPGGESMD